MSNRSKYLLFASLIILLALLLRSVQLLRFPVFADEAIYASWSLAIGKSIENINLPILDGKPPLYMLLYSQLFNILNIRPILLARLISVIFGVLTVLLIFPLAKVMRLKLRARLIAVYLAAISFYLVYLSRLGLLDSMLTFFTTIAFILVLLVLTGKQAKHSLITAAAGILLGLALWTKTSAFFMMLPILFLGFFYSWQKKQSRPLLFSLIILLLSGAFFLVLARLSVFPSLLARSQDFTFSLTEVLTREYLFSLNNIFLFITWLGSYTGWISLFLVPFAVYRYHSGPLRPVAVAALLLVLPLLIFGKVLSPRYLLPVLPIWIIFIAAAIAALPKARFLQILIVAVITIQMLPLDLALIINPDQTRFVARDTSEYLTNWSSGHGIYETAMYITQIANQSGRVSVATEGFYGPLPTGLQLVLYGDTRIDVYGIGQPIYSLPDRTLIEAQTQPTFLVVNRDRLKRMIPNTDLIAEYPRPGGGESLLLFRVNPRK